MPTTHSTTADKTSVKSRKPTPSKSGTPKTAAKFVTPEQRYKMIAEAAYFIAEKRGFSEGDKNSDWLNAEADIDKMLTNQ